MWKQCPYAPHPARKDYVYPVTNSPMAITASRQLQTFPIRVFYEPLPSDAVVPEYCATHEDDVFCDDSSPPRVRTPFNPSYAGRTSYCNPGHPHPTLTSNHIKFYLTAAAGAYDSDSAASEYVDSDSE